MRTHLSAITLIALLGVAIGVLVLIVVLAVMAGFEREVKARILGFTPHIVVQSRPGGMPGVMSDWNGAAEMVKKVDGVEDAFGFLADNTILDFAGLQRPVYFRAVDSENPAQIASLDSLLAKDKYGGTAEMGLGENAVISEGIAQAFGLRVGDVIQLYSTRNFQQVFRAYKTTERPPVAEEFRGELDAIMDELRAKVAIEDGREVFVWEELSDIYYRIDAIAQENIRPGEEEILESILAILREGETTENNEKKILPAGTIDTVEQSLDLLHGLDFEHEDARVLKEIKEFVLPKDVTVVGVFKATQHVVHPDLFIPLPSGQELKGLYQGVDGLGVWTSDPYKAGVIAERLQAEMGEGYGVVTWMKQHEDFFNLIANERIMMYFALSFIMLVSAFCISGIMFTVTILKKQEIGVMKALGARPSQIVRVFLFQGMIIGVVGAVLGVGLGLLVVHFRGGIHRFLRDVLGFDPFPASVHGIDTLPAHVNPVEVVWIAIGAFILCSLAGLVPALFAAWKDAAKSLRNI